MADDDDDIAVIGIGCRVPGADNAEEFWQVLVNGENYIVDIPEDRWNNDAFYSDDKEEAEKVYVKKAGFIKGHDEWDNKFFGVSESEAVSVDPQQRLVLDCTHMALEDAGITRKQLKGSQTGVYIGVMNDDYKGLSSFEHKDDTSYTATGMSTTIISARVSYVYDLRGPCMAVDTACSSSMVAIHLGSQAIRSGDCEMAVCGGVSLMLTPDQFITLCKARMLSPTGQCQSFCDTADGYARGEGCGIVIIKSYKQALRDRNKIWGIIKTGSNQDGHTTQPITAPSGEQQEKLMKKIYSQNKIDPTSIQYIEAHGTGTSIGDPTEINAIGKFIKSFRLKHPPDNKNTYQTETDLTCSTSSQSKSTNTILIGSVKSNIGHLESAAGVAALIKVLLMMNHGKFVPSLHVKKDKSNMNKKINLDEYGLDIALEVAEWKPNKDGQRICCVNCFGFGGSNTHAIVLQKALSNQSTQLCDSSDHTYKVIALSDLNQSSLRHNLKAFGDDLERKKHNMSLQDVSYTSVFHRDLHSYRTIIFGKNAEDIQQDLKRKLAETNDAETEKRLRVIFVFCGVGTTWKGMCMEMMKTHAVFKTSIFNIDHYLKPLTGWSIAEMFEKDTDYTDPFVNHIAIFCTQVALFETWKSWGIYPQAIIGQSVGEVAAAYASGALNLKNAIEVIYIRSSILSQMTGGKMMVVRNLSVDSLESICQKYQNRVEIAVYNSPISCTLSGDADVMEHVKTDLQNLNLKGNSEIIVTPLSVQCAYHSHHMDPCIDLIGSKLKHLEKGRRRTQHVSTVTGKLAVPGDFQTGQYWADNIRKPVLFMHAIQQSLDQNAKNFLVEIGPRQVVRAHLNNIMGPNWLGKCLPSMNAYKECQSIYSTLSNLVENGADVAWRNIVPCVGNIVSIPKHVFQKTKRLNIPKGKQYLLKGVSKSIESHLFVRQSVENGFQLHLHKETSPFVYDHFMYNRVLVPGATYVETGLEIGNKKSALNAFEISVSIEFVNTLMPENEKQCLVDVDVEENGQNEYKYYIRKNEKILCEGKVVPRKEQRRIVFNIETIKQRCKKHRTREENYKCLDDLHFQYGESLEVIEQSWSSSTECIVEYKIPETVMKYRKATHMHPSVIDGLFQTAVLLGTSGFDRPALPKSLTSFVINRPPQSHMFGYTKLVKSTKMGNYYYMSLLCPGGQVLAEVYDFYIKIMADGSEQVQKIQYSTTWKEIEIPLSILERKEKTVKSTITMFASDRFLSSYKPTHDEHLEFVDMRKQSITMQTLQKIHKADKIIYAPSYHVLGINDGRRIFEYIQKSFANLSVLIRALHEKKLEIPVFVVTENVMSHLERTTNVCGAELWGMVRSAVMEGAYKYLTLVDMVFSQENTPILQRIIKNATETCSEYLIEGGRVYHSVIEEQNETETCLRRQIRFVQTEHIILKSLSPCSMKQPSFEMTSKDHTLKQMTQQYKIRLKEICLHDPSMFLLTQKLASDEDILLTENESEYPVMCIEGIGRQFSCTQNNFQSREKGFCFPVNVSAVIAVPLKCSYDIADLPLYVPGMITVGVVLLNIVDTCKHSSRVSCIVPDESRLWVQLLIHLFSSRTSTSLTTESVNTLSDKNKRQHIRTVIILTNLNCDQLTNIVQQYPDVHRIVSIEQFLSKEKKMVLKVRNESVSFCILKSEDMFSSSELTRKVPKVVSSFKSVSNKTDHCCEQHGKDVFSLPYSTLIIEDETGNTSIPLMVSQENVFRTNGCYIVVGGLTGLGWELVQLIASLGAKYIATLSRRLPEKEKRLSLTNIEKKHSCMIVPLQVDITDINQLKNGIEQLGNIIGRDVSIRGVLHGGGVTCDKYLRNMSAEDVEQVLLPKVLGTWNLHYVTLSMPLDFFIMHSSVVAVLGNQGQCNYAAGNSFQDSFAHFRRSLGLCGQSINWSALSIGMAMEKAEVQKYLRSQGFHYLSIDEIKKCFMHAVMENQVQVMFGKFDWQKMQQNPTIEMNHAKFVEVLKRYPATTGQLIETSFSLRDFYNKTTDERQKYVYDLVKSKIVEAFVVNESNLNGDTNVVMLGIDSIAAMNFSSSVFNVINVRIPIEVLFDEHTTLGTLTQYILDHMPKGLETFDSKGEQTEEILQRFLQGNVTFMQKSLLDDFVKDPFSRNILRQVDFEIKGLSLQRRDWKAVLSHLIKINPDLRRIYIINEDGSYDSFLLDRQEVDVEIEEANFDSICSENTRDEREKVHMDITKELPIRVLMAFEKGTTRIRMFVHAVLGDLSGIIILFKEINEIAKCYTRHKDLPEKDENIVPAKAVREAILPRMNDLKQFWKRIFKENIKPFTLADDIDMKLDENLWETEIKKLPANLVYKIMDFIKTEGVSMYHFVISIYMLLLHEKTGKKLIPLVTNIDMRGHVPQLKSFITRCSNAIPVIGDFRDIGTVSAYLKQCSDHLNKMTQNGAYPYELIEKEMQTKELKKHIGRHRLIMENMTNLNASFEHQGVEIKLGKFYYKRHVYETTMHIVYDTQQNDVILEFGFNSKAVTRDSARQLLDRMLDRMWKFIDFPEKEISSFLNEYNSSAASQTSDKQSSGQDHPLGTNEQGMSGRSDCILKGNNIQCCNQNVIRKDAFVKQTKQGWEHMVKLKIVRQVSKNGNMELKLVWGHGKKEKMLCSQNISEVEVKRLNGMFYILVKSLGKVVVFKAQSHSKALSWLETFKQVDEEIKTVNRQQMICNH